MTRLADQLISGDRGALARAITLVESTRADHQEQARDLLTFLMDRTGDAWRVGLTGSPGVGKSTLIEKLGTTLTGAGRRVAVLAVDPSSSRTRGSILGDKTRMGTLATDKNAFIRPSPSAGTLGGVAKKTRESMLLCEAAGYDVVIVETVGVGQSEIVVADMVDVFVALMLPGAGDELQGIKKGLVEIADIFFVNKAEGENAERARRSAKDLQAALHLLSQASQQWEPVVLTGSALTGDSVDKLWETIERHRETLQTAGALQEKRSAQQVRWLWSLVEDRLIAAFRRDVNVKKAATELEAAVAAGRLPASEAAERLLRAGER